MDSFLLLVFFLRPILNIDVGTRVVGTDVFDLVVLALTGVLLVAWLLQVPRLRRRDFGSSGALGLAFGGWCILLAVIYPGASNLKDAVKFAIPPVTYVLIRPFLRSERQYRRYIAIMLLGFSVPVLGTAYLISTGAGVDRLNWTTGLVRYQGLYYNSHDLGHAMTFFLMSCTVLVLLRACGNPRASFTNGPSLLVAGAAAVGLYCLYFSYVRTAIVGLAVFCLIASLSVNVRTTAALLLLGAAYVAVDTERLEVLFFDVTEVAAGERAGERIASGRPVIWQHNVERYLRLPLDRQIAGVGIGNRITVSTTQAGSDNIWNSHNDLLEVVIQTGLFGFALYAAFHLVILASIGKLEPRRRWIYLALFFAVMAMNFGSNSYVTRYSIGQMLYMLLAYVESKAATRVADGGAAHPAAAPSGA